MNLYRRLNLLPVILIALSGANAALLAQQTPTIGGCPIFPSDNVWNTRIDTLPVDPNSATYINAQGGSGVPLHPDFGTVWNGAPNGYPYVVVSATQPKVPIIYTAYGSESDPGPYPIPADAPIEGGASSTGDRHVLVVQSGTCILWELFSAYPQADGSWKADSGAVFDLTKNGPLRPAGWTSTDAAGLPVTAGLVRYDEVQAAIAGDGMVHHAFRFTIPYSQAAYVWPARHFASTSNNPAYLPMGVRFRLKASVNIDYYPGTTTKVSAINRAILQTLKTYGMFVSDNGGPFFVCGVPDTRWDDADLHSLGNFKATDFEALDESSLIVDPNSGQAKQPTTPTASTSGSITAPVSGQTVSGTVAISAQGQSGVGIASAQFVLDGATTLSTQTGSGPTFSYQWNSASVANGTHSLTVVITDTASNRATSSPVSFTVLNTTPSPTPSTSSAAFLFTDMTTAGNWKGVYGSDGSLIPLDSIHAPSYATVAFDSSTQLWNWTPSGTTDRRALLRYNSATDRIASTYYHAPGFSVDVNLSDGQPHRMTLYLSDFDYGGRAETITIRDAATNAILDSQTLTRFYAAYYAWTIQGHVVVQATSQVGPNAVINALFFDPPSATAATSSPSATFRAIDTATRGNWNGVYGADGTLIPQDLSRLPSYAAVTPGPTALYWNWLPSGNTSDARALLKPGSSTDRSVTTYYSNGSTFTLDLNLTDGKSHRLALYLMDWDYGKRTETIVLRNASTGAALDSQTVSSFENGKWLTWTVSGHLTMEANRVGGTNALINGLFFDTP